MEWKERFEQLKRRIEQERDEIVVKAHLAKMDARDVLPEEIEAKWEAFKTGVAEVRASEATEEVLAKADRLATDLREGYRKIQDTIRKRLSAEMQAGAKDGGRDGSRADSPDPGAPSGASGDAAGDASGSYTMGYGDEFQRVLERRSAKSHAANLLPLLRPGMKLLDFGCGPGTISMGLAKAIEPGELHGVDMEASQIEMAKAAAAAGGHSNATFHTGDVTSLPFEDDTFDVAHCNAVLMHLPGTKAALSEVKRVLKPGGLLSVQELITASSFLEPSFSMLDGAWQVFSKLLAANGGHPQMGKEAKGVLHEAGFAEVTADAFFEIFDSDGDRAFFHNFISDWFFSPRVVEPALQHGFLTKEYLDELRSGLERWRDHPGAFGTFAWGSATGRKPVPQV